MEKLVESIKNVFKKKKILNIQYFDKKYGWMFVLPMEDYSNEDKANKVIEQLKLIFKGYEYRIKDEEIELEDGVQEIGEE